MAERGRALLCKSEGMARLRHAQQSEGIAEQGTAKRRRGKAWRGRA